MTDDPRLTPLARSLPATVPFVGPEAQERARGEPFAARLGANESGFGPSPRALEAMRRAAGDAWKYADPESHELKAALARLHGIAPAQIAVDAGIDTLLGLAVRLYLAPGEVAVTSLGAYPTFNYHVAGFGGRLETVPYTGDHEDPERLIAKARETGARLIYIANPDNPMGSHHDAETIARMIGQVPEGCLLLLDEAYIELAPPGTAPAIDPDDPRVLRLRTFSKAHGMAGTRVGYAIGAESVVRAFDRVRNHFGMNRIAQAGALAAMEDADYLDTVRLKVMRAREAIAATALDNGLVPLPSATNFVAVDCGRDGDFARTVLRHLLTAGIFVRMPFVAPQDRCIRVSCGASPELAAFAAALPDALAKARAETKA